MAHTGRSALRVGMENELIAQLLGGVGIVFLLLAGLSVVISRQQVHRKQAARQQQAQVGVIKGSKPAQQPPSYVVYPDSTHSHY